MNKWIDIWEDEPPHEEDIFFMTGGEDIHYGVLQGFEKLRKCEFYCYCCKKTFECDKVTKPDDRVMFWFPIPEIPVQTTN